MIQNTPEDMMKISYGWLVAAYALSLSVDVTVLAGCTWLVLNGWSGWWYALAVLLVSGSFPTSLVNAWRVANQLPEVKDEDDEEHDEVGHCQCNRSRILGPND
jgi:hypothetical protein